VPFVPRRFAQKLRAEKMQHSAKANLTRPEPLVFAGPPEGKAPEPSETRTGRGNNENEFVE
jgi:hypothetical protein